MSDTPQASTTLDIIAREARVLSIIKAELKAANNSVEPKDFEEYWINRVGKTLYNMFVNQYSKKMWMIGDNRIYLLADGRLVNLAAAEGHPASVMDMSFSTQALASAWMAKQINLQPGVYEVSEEIERKVSSTKLASMGLSLDELTPEQKKYLQSWQEGT